MKKYLKKPLLGWFSNPQTKIIPSRHLFVPSQQQKHQNIVWNLFKVHNKDDVKSLWTWSHILRKFLMENFIFCAMICTRKWNLERDFFEEIWKRKINISFSCKLHVSWKNLEEYKYCVSIKPLQKIGYTSLKSFHFAERYRQNQLTTCVL